MSTFDLGDATVATLHFGFDRENWHPALVQALEGVTAEQAAWRPADGRNSIHDIVLHLLHWKRAALDNFEPLATRDAFDAYAAQDWQREAAVTVGWEGDVRQLMEVSKQLIETVEAAGAEELASPLEHGRRARALNLLNLATHDAYHAGQIRLLRVLQGA